MSFSFQTLSQAGTHANKKANTANPKRNMAGSQMLRFMLGTPGNGGKLILQSQST
jgi:hypothetical protein